MLTKRVVLQFAHIKNQLVKIYLSQITSQRESLMLDSLSWDMTAEIIAQIPSRTILLIQLQELKLVMEHLFILTHQNPLIRHVSKVVISQLTSVTIRVLIVTIVVNLSK